MLDEPITLRIILTFGCGWILGVLIFYAITVLVIKIQERRRNRRA